MSEWVSDDEESYFSSPAYKKVIEANNRRSAVPTMDWCPDEDNPPDIHPLAVEGDCKPCVDLPQDKELTKAECFNAIVEGMKILGWDDKEEKKQ